ncbi:MAG: hypothetical protein WC829_03225 [Hyphomicrobium sp.]|jgi:hypothetical protein
MNRYTAAGLALAAITKQHRIIVISPRTADITAALESFEHVDFIRDQAEIRRADPRVSFHLGGKIIFRSARQSLRGMTADTVYIEEDVLRHTLSTVEQGNLLRDAQLVTTAAGGDIVIGA